MKEGQGDAFAEVAASLKKAHSDFHRGNRADYSWFMSEDGHTCTVTSVFTDGEGLQRWAECDGFQTRQARLFEACEIGTQLLGDAGPARERYAGLREIFQGDGVVERVRE